MAAAIASDWIFRGSRRCCWTWRCHILSYIDGRRYDSACMRHHQVNCNEWTIRSLQSVMSSVCSIYCMCIKNTTAAVKETAEPKLLSQHESTVMCSTLRNNNVDKNASLTVTRSWRSEDNHTSCSHPEGHCGSWVWRHNLSKAGCFGGEVFRACVCTAVNKNADSVRPSMEQKVHDLCQSKLQCVHVLQWWQSFAEGRRLSNINHISDAVVRTRYWQHESKKRTRQPDLWLRSW